MEKVVLHKEKLHSNSRFKMMHDLAFHAVGVALDQWRAAGGPKDGMAITLPNGKKYMVEDHNISGDYIELNIVELP